MGSSDQRQRILTSNEIGNDASIFLGDKNYYNISQRPETPPQPFASIPFRRDPDFVNRGDILEQIDQQCSAPSGRMALVGLGGVGKSQLAIEYAYQFADKFNNSWVFWVHAGNRARVNEGFRTIADTVKLAGRSDSNADIGFLVHNWLSNERNGRWLMVLDSADDFDVFCGSSEAGHKRPFMSYLPQSRNGSILITTRNKDVAIRLTGDADSSIQIGPMTPDEALTLLTNRLESPSQKLSHDLLEALDFIPLAISQAAAYIRKNEPRSSVEKYLANFRKSERDQARLLELDAGDFRRDGAALNAIFTTWQISFDQIRSKSHSAAELLSLMSFFDSQGIPEWLLRYTGESLSILQEIVSTETGDYHTQEGKDYHLKNKAENGTCMFEDDMILLRDYCLINVNEEGDKFDMHKLVQLSTRNWLKSSDQQFQPMQQCIKRLSTAFPAWIDDNVTVCRGLFPHARLVLDYLPDEELIEDWARLLHHCGCHAFTEGQDDIGVQMLETAAKYRAKRLGVEHSEAIASSRALATAKYHLMQWEEAEKLLLETIEACNVGWENHDIDILTCMTFLASIYRLSKRQAEAEELEAKAMDLIKTKLKGVTCSSDAAILMEYLAGIHQSQGRSDEAEKLCLQALESYKAEIGASHIITLLTLGDLASIYSDMGKLDDAEKVYEETLRMIGTKLGPHHPTTLSIMGPLSRVYGRQHRWEEAEMLAAKTMIYRSQLGPENFSTTSSMENLALIQYLMGKRSAALELMQECARLRERKLGSDHPQTLEAAAFLEDWLILEDWLKKKKKKTKKKKKKKTKKEEEQRALLMIKFTLRPS